MYTGMHGIRLDETYVRRCSLMWWTVYVLERRMSSLLGVPMGISEESISASFPSTSSNVHGSNVLEMQVMLCQILAKVDLSKFSLALSDGFAKKWQLCMAVKANLTVAI